VKNLKGCHGFIRWDPKLFRSNARTTQIYSPKCVSACVWHSHVDGGEKIFVVIFEKIWEVKTRTLILCVLPTKFPNCLLCIDWSKCESLGGEQNLEKHQEGNNKNACQVAMSNELMAILIKGIWKACCTSTQRGYEIQWYEWRYGEPRWKASMISINAIHAQVEEGGISIILKAPQPLYLMIVFE